MLLLSLLPPPPAHEHGEGVGSSSASELLAVSRSQERRICGRHRAEERGMSWKPAALLEEVEGKCPRLRRVAGVGRVGC